MKDLKKQIAVVCLLLLISAQSSAKKASWEEGVKIGSLCPFFEFKAKNGKKINSSSIKGKYSIFYFWAKSCGSCVVSMPKLNKLMEGFDKNDLNFTSVCYLQPGAEELYDKLEKKWELNLSTAFDSTYFNILSPGAGVPTVLWLNKEGKVVAFSTSDDLTQENIENLINDREFKFTDATPQGKRDYIKDNPEKPLLINGNGGSDSSFLFRSVLALSPSEARSTYYGDIDYFLKAYAIPKFEIIGSDLSRLYQIAYFGRESPPKFWPVPILLLKDPSKFQAKNEANGRQGLYTYSLTISQSGANKQVLMREMQMDLHRYFGYRAGIRDTLLPCLKLIITDKTKTSLLKNHETQVGEKWKKFEGGKLQKVKLDWALDLMVSKLPGSPYVINSTGIQDEVTLVINALLINITEIKNELRKYGLDLIEDKALIKALIIGDE